MKKQLEEVLYDIIARAGATDMVPVVEMSQDPAHGEYSTNIAMALFAKLKLQTPNFKWKSSMDVALWVKEEMSKKKTETSQREPDHNIKQKDQKYTHGLSILSILQDIDRIEVAPPGFINFYISEAKLGASIGEVLRNLKGVGKGQSLVVSSRSPDTSKSLLRIVVEFTDPNPFKEFHIGHLYSNSVGESISRLLESQGHTVRRVCYQGDVGLHVAKSIWGLLYNFKLGTVNLEREQIQAKLAELEKFPLAQRMKILGQAYAAGAAAYEDESDKGKQAAEEMKVLNRLIFIAAQQIAKKNGYQPRIDYRKNAEIDEAQLSIVAALYEAGRAWSLEYFETIYRRLGTAFDGYYFESQVGEVGVELVREFLKKGVFEESDGAVVYRGEKKKLHTRVFVNSLGLPTYEAKELGLAPAKAKDWEYDRSLIVTGNEINEYFRVLLAALSEIRPELAAKTRHIGHGMVRKPDGSKMSSRSGQVLTGEGLLGEVKQSIYAILDTSTSPLKVSPLKGEREEIAEAAAVAAVKYSLLRVSLPSDVSFDIEKSVSFDGDSGPYLLYTYARCKSVEKKAAKVAGKKVTQVIRGLASDTSYASDTFFNTEERAIARLLLFFPDVVAEAARTLAPSILCNYLFKLAQAFNGFYQKYTIIEDDTGGRGSRSSIVGHKSSVRIHMTAATARVLEAGLHLLGIRTVERM